MDGTLNDRLLDVVNEENRKHVYQVFECAGPDLKTVIKKFPGKIKNPKIVKVSQQYVISNRHFFHINLFLYYFSVDYLIEAELGFPLFLNLMNA